MQSVSSRKLKVQVPVQRWTNSTGLGPKFQDRATIDVGRPRGTVEITAEGGELVPGIEQKLYLALTDDEGEPIGGTFAVQADGLKTDVTTNAHGEGAVSWRVPQGIGAKRDVGPCPGSIAAQEDQRDERVERGL